MTRIDEAPHKLSVHKVEGEKEAASRIPVPARQLIVTLFRFDSNLVIGEVIGQVGSWLHRTVTANRANRKKEDKSCEALCPRPGQVNLNPSSKVFPARAAEPAVKIEQ